MRKKYKSEGVKQLEEITGDTGVWGTKKKKKKNERRVQEKEIT